MLRTIILVVAILLAVTSVSVAAPPVQVCNNLWNVKWFGCDCGHDNVYSLNRDGTPICGSSNCSSSPGMCWGAPVTRRNHGGDISWSIGSMGELLLAHGQDYQVYGDTYLYVDAPKTLVPPLSCDVGRLWLNNVEVTHTGPTLSLAVGWNHVEWTSYNQNQSTRFDMNYPFASHVERMNSAPNLCLVAIPRPQLPGALDVADAPEAGRCLTVYPNPVKVGGTITIWLEVPVGTSTTLAIYDVSGRLVEMLVSSAPSLGSHAFVWDGRDAEGRPAAPGIYFLRATAGGFAGSRRIVVQE